MPPQSVTHLRTHPHQFRQPAIPSIILILIITTFTTISVSSLQDGLILPLHRRSQRNSCFIRARLNLINKYSHWASAESLQKRQIAVPIIETLPSSNSTLSNSPISGFINSTSIFNHSTTLRGVSDGRGGVVGLQRTFNFQADLEYFTSIQIGEPPQDLSVILDTGSADFWVASTNCNTTTGCSTGLGPKFDPINSSVTNTAFSIKYGSGSATGKMYTDNMTFAGYNISNQKFAVVDTVSSELLSKDVSGLMGFQPLAASGVMPIWQSLLSNASQYNLSFPGFSFALTRFINQTGAKEVEPGGLFTLGTLNSSLFDGEIEFIPLPKGLESYWLIPMGGLDVNGIPVDLGSEITKNVAIDSGTTLLGGPADQVKSFYKHVPGSVPATGSYQGYYSYPCNLTVNVSLQFGTRNYSMAPQDFNLGPFGNNGMCLGAVFELTLSGASKQLISWVM
ncbi:hypothetical protein CROQUDRAFT_51617 [Cronartium quercuum f. sp. fusiforme G11]|uniref:Peptidase A1 domain-containing protein n=1 Tax=Cronartium quercuum f. sp. fusiforme G11 TaxID=708437 RepID=A0A9P6NCG1_9BASI|nr:hypothetical protein CROQUDRAFT_51617 [Cronartium quercuum f. sp. fusiforme G11]